MSKKKKKETIRQIIARAPEDASQLGGYDGDKFAYLEGLISELESEKPFDRDERDPLIDFLKNYVLPKLSGRPPKSPEAKADKAKKNAEAYQWGRDHRAALIASGMERTTATQQTVDELKVRHFHNIDKTTIRDRLLRRQNRQ